FQAEDGIRDLYVTGVQTCALPICLALRLGAGPRQSGLLLQGPGTDQVVLEHLNRLRHRADFLPALTERDLDARIAFREAAHQPRSEERRVGKECRSPWLRHHEAHI